MVFSLRCIYTLYLKGILTYLNMLKIQTKVSRVHLHILRVHEVVSRKTIRGLCKKKKIGAKISLFADTFFLSFFVEATKSIRFSQKFV
jgi:hypothetical protein